MPAHAEPLTVRQAARRLKGSGMATLTVLEFDAVPDRLAAELKARNLTFKLVAGNLSAEQKARLRDIFGAEEA